MPNLKKVRFFLKALPELDFKPVYFVTQRADKEFMKRQENSKIMVLKRKPKQNVELNRIYQGDNLSFMRSFPEAFIDLIYIDPPFGTQSLWSSKAWGKSVQTEA